MELGEVRAESLLRALWDIGMDAETERAADRIKALELCGKMLGVFERGGAEGEAPAPAAALSVKEKERLLRAVAADFGGEVEADG